MVNPPPETPDHAKTIYDLLRKQTTSQTSGGFIPNWSPPLPVKRCTCRICPCCGGQVPTVEPHQPTSTPWINIGNDPNRLNTVYTPKPGDVGTWTING